MKNKEMFSNEILELACDHHSIAVNKITGKVVNCKSINCEKCRFDSINCTAQLREWAESEYTEPLSAKTVLDEFNGFCRSSKTCNDCKYSGIPRGLECAMEFIFDNYEVKEKAEVKENDT